MWGIGKNRELRDLYGEADIVAAVKAQTWRRLGHVVRMRSDRGPEMSLKRKPEGVRRRGRPRRRWYEDVAGDLRQMRVQVGGVRLWTEKNGGGGSLSRPGRCV